MLPLFRAVEKNNRIEILEICGYLAGYHRASMNEFDVRFVENYGLLIYLYETCLCLALFNLFQCMA